ncbi:MAG: hypothetical protein LBQ68_09565, partial [Clostridiales bacterium]|nr:hypothetical protein [Clostridiales bacterium]
MNKNCMTNHHRRYTPSSGNNSARNFRSSSTGSGLRRSKRPNKKFDIKKIIQSLIVCGTFIFLFFLCSKRIDGTAFFLNATLPSFSMQKYEEKPLNKLGVDEGSEYVDSLISVS